jgi:capsule polysaccharide modification protein KpsS
MKLDGSTKFEECLDSVQAFWSDKTKAEQDWSLFVDAMHDNMDYIFFNFHLSKVVQEKYKCSLVSATKNWETPLISYQPNANEAIANAFGVNEFYHLDTLSNIYDDSFQEKLLKIKALLSENELSLRHLIFGDHNHLEQDDRDLLRIAYDHYLRSVLKPTETKLNEEFIQVFCECYSFRKIARKIVEKNNIKIAVLGHVEYNPYYFIAEAVLKNGGCVLFHWPLVFGSVRILRTLDDLRVVKSKDFESDYQTFYLNKKSELKSAIEEYSQGLIDRLTKSRSYADFNQFHIEMSKEEFFRSTGIKSPREKSIVLLSHALTDAVHANGPMLFDDFSTWLEETISHFAEHESINVLVKVHPKDLTYVRDSWITYLYNKFKDVSNFGIVSKHINNREVAKFCEVGSTVQGTPGYEMPLQGLKTVVAGEARYSRLGITPHCTSASEYFGELEKACFEPEITETVIEKAIDFAFFENIYTKLNTSFIPGMAQVDINSPKWLGLASCFTNNLLSLDPVYRAISNIDIFDESNPSFLTNPILA